jgi:hypothetical protein
VAWFWLLITIITDIFRDDELSGGGKALWCLFVLLLPWIGVLTYLLVRGRSMNERAMRQAAHNERAFRSYVREAAGPGEASVADELSKLADLRDQGKISQDDYEKAKSRVLGGMPVTDTPVTAERADGTTSPV